MAIPFSYEHSNVGDFINDSENFDEHDPSESDTIDEDDQIMPFQLPEQMRYSDSDDEQSSGDFTEECDELDNISLSPPSNLPVLLIDIEKLCGYKACDDEEYDQMCRQIRRALLGSSSKSNTTDPNCNHVSYTPLDDHISFEFIERSKQLFDEKVAKHGTSDNPHQKSNQVSVDYPEFLPIAQDDGATSLVSTARIWKTIIRPHRIHIVNRILSLLSECSRDIIWKYQMCLEIWSVSRNENRKKEQYETKRKLQIWRLEKRPLELEKLYDAREMFEIRLAASKEKFSVFNRERERRIQNELRRRAEKGIGNGGIAGLDWDTRITFGFGDDIEEVALQINEKRIEGMIEKGQLTDCIQHDETDMDNGVSCSEIDGDYSIGTNDSKEDDVSTKDNTFSIASSSERNKRRAARLRKQKMENRKTIVDDVNDLEIRKKIEIAYREERSIREMFTTSEERMAHSVVIHLESQLKKVDDLIETLQEEQWRDEENGLLNEDLHDLEDEMKDQQSPSILDSILAMILGALNIDDDIPLHEHFVNIERIHRELVMDWKQEFGRLPDFQNTENSRIPDDLKQHNDEIWNEENANVNDRMERLVVSNETGVSENDQIRNLSAFVPDNWDDEESSDDGWDSEPPPFVVPVDDFSSKPSIILRPGGRTYPTP